MKQAIYPGTFNPWHKGHRDVLNKARRIFDTVCVAYGGNPDKPMLDQNKNFERLKFEIGDLNGVEVVRFDGLLVDFIHSINTPIHAIVRGLRNGQDLENERLQQYWNEDLAKESELYLPPTVYIVTSRDLVHISSSAIRAVEKIKGAK